jgi:aminopeptidase N
VALRDPVTHVVGIAADRATYDTLLTLARKSTVTSERLRYYFAAAAARDPALARTTLDIALGDEVPGTIVTGLISTVGFAGEQPGLAWRFLQENYDALLAKQGSQFRDQFIANFMTNFSDESRAAELAAFAPVQATSGGRVMAGRAQEVIAISADLKSRALPAIDAWIRGRK